MSSNIVKEDWGVGWGEVPVMEGREAENEKFLRSGFCHQIAAMVKQGKKDAGHNFAIW